MIDESKRRRRGQIMSLIVAVKDKDRYVLGADKQSSAGGNKDHSATKIWEVGNCPGIVMGGVGSARATQVIQYSKLIRVQVLKYQLILHQMNHLTLPQTGLLV